MKNIIRMGLLAGALVTSVAAHAQNSWTDKLTLGGDFRFRYNKVGDDRASAVATTTNNNQIRARITASAKVNDAMTANFRLVTDAGDPRSANHTLDNSAHANTAFDLAYADWRLMPGLVLSAGKAPNPFWQGGKNEMIWDADLAFDGVTAKWAADMDSVKPFVNLSYNTLDQRQTAGSSVLPNVMLLGAQVGASTNLGSTAKGTLAVGYHTFNAEDFYVAGVKGYNLLDVTAEVGTDSVHNIPLAVYGDYVQNSKSDGTAGDKTGWLAGLKAGQFNNVGSWEAWYNFRDVGSQAVVATLADSETAGGASVNLRGHQVGAGYMAWDNTTVGLNYWNDHNNGANGSHYERWTADLVWKF